MSIKVSVSILAYNHESFIEQAVRSVLSQRTNFDYEIVVGEDCSTDRTLEILTRLKDEFPDKIRLLTNHRNLGMIQNSIRSLQACDGEYVAMLDGDDYWCAEDKLQKQVDFLDQHPDFAISFHSVMKVTEDGSRPPKLIRPDETKDAFELGDLINSNFIPTCSVVIRNGWIGEFPDWAYSLKMLDWLTLIMAAKHGKIGFIDEMMAVYRIHDSGVWSSLDLANQHKAYINFFEKLNPYLEYRYANAIQTRLNYHWAKLTDDLYEDAIALGSTASGLNFAEETWNDLKSYETAPPNWEKQFLERVYNHYLFTAFEAGDYPAAWSAWVGLIRISPGRLCNRGVLSIGMKSVQHTSWRSLIQGLNDSTPSKNG
jgi:glycosyltransferase involved in cell wall biosynthesis